MPTHGAIFYAERGFGPPLVCIHGAGGTHTHWGALLAALAPHARIRALDLPGHGRSAPPRLDSIGAYAVAVASLCDELALERPVLVGHSMGAAVALELAAASPERVGGLVLLGAAARLRVAPALLQGLADDAPAAVGQLVAQMYPNAPQLQPAAVAGYLRGPATLRADFLLCDGWDLRPRLAGLALPALVIGGEADALTPPRLMVELQGLLGARLALLPAVGHVPMIEAPAATAELIAVWLATNR